MLIDRRLISLQFSLFTHVKCFHILWCKLKLGKDFFYQFVVMIENGLGDSKGETFMIIIYLILKHLLLRSNNSVINTIGNCFDKSRHECKLCWSQMAKFLCGSVKKEKKNVIISMIVSTGILVRYELFYKDWW